MTRIVVLLGLVALLGLSLTARAAPVESLRDPRPRAWVLDTTGTLDGAARAALEGVARDVRSSGRGELMVVVSGSVDGEPPRAYATRLFNAWRIGSSARSDGVLVFAALTDRKAEIVLGDGVDGAAEVRASEEIMQGEIVPRFKRGDPAGALLAGARACAGRILRVPAYGGATEGGKGGAAYAVIGGAALGAGGLSVGALAFVGYRLATRRRRRKCARCRSAMVRLDEVRDDAYLTSGERVEEHIRSVDYDVWLCRCGAMEKLRYGALFTRYAACPRCHARTKLSTTTTVQSPTAYSEGIARVEERCAHCGYHHAFTRSIPRYTPSDSSSSSSSFDSGGSSGSSDSGGGSSGGGASGSW
jgi:uncharacterized protein